MFKKFKRTTYKNVEQIDRVASDVICSHWPNKIEMIQKRQIGLPKDLARKYGLYSATVSQLMTAKELVHYLTVYAICFQIISFQRYYRNQKCRSVC